MFGFNSKVCEAHVTRLHPCGETFHSESGKEMTFVCECQDWTSALMLAVCASCKQFSVAQL